MLRTARSGTAQRESLGEAVYRELQQWIGDGSLLPEMGLREVDLAGKLKTSRTPVREALRRLEAEGLVDRSPAGGYVLHTFTREDLAMVYDVREALEALAARLAAKHRSRTHLGRLADTLELMDDAIKHKDTDEVRRLAGFFHETIAEASGNWYLRDVLKNVRSVIVRFRSEKSPYTLYDKAMQADHYKLLDALSRQDADEMERIVKEHTDHALALRIGAMEQQRGGKKKQARVKKANGTH